MLDTDTTVHTTRHRGTPVVVVTGEVDSTTVEPVREQVFDQLDRHPRGLVLDLSGVDFIGSTGLQMLAEAITRARDLGAVLAVAAEHRAVLLPMRITELDREIAVRRTVDQAVTAVLTR
ncbi:STAS domain-containing protein [Saccharothrix syringae]|uniref:Anti-sigma factor antagonist n=1 Tax=Saccharothrix syringae TaxID=103733 RepID=A0A5Q0H1I8_SACSY|nr:STAS domain-containing protein [Saccharothrix syringae]QFZ19714.1 anti-sigma factor antagonist [Saccharothrix syringae]